MSRVESSQSVEIFGQCSRSGWNNVILEEKMNNYPKRYVASHVNVRNWSGTIEISISISSSLPWVNLFPA